MVTPLPTPPSDFKSGIFSTRSEKAQEISTNLKKQTDKQHGIIYSIVSRVMNTFIGRPLADLTVKHLEKENVDPGSENSKLAKIPYVRTLSMQNSIRKEIQMATEDLNKFDGEITQANLAWSSRMKTIDEAREKTKADLAARHEGLGKVHSQIRSKISELQGEDYAIRLLEEKLKKSMDSAEGSPDELQPDDALELGWEIAERRKALDKSTGEVEQLKNQFESDYKTYREDSKAAKESYTQHRRQAYEETIAAVDGKYFVAKSKIGAFMESLKGTPLYDQAKDLDGYLNVLHKKKFMEPRTDSIVKELRSDFRAATQAIIDARRQCVEQYKNSGVHDQYNKIDQINREIVDLKSKLGSEGTQEEDKVHLKGLLKKKEEELKQAEKDYQDELNNMLSEFINPVNKRVDALEAKIKEIINDPSIANLKIDDFETFINVLDKLRDHIEAIKKHKYES